ncbi:hypothetical protein KDK_66000 [Dictyobacter kobayashii]|uniref:Uncharacterized protein n=1 Tax=Dictyobacter kobayashii TaxID=2014872 RepID=A0A402AUK2_9CHLR|nr:hypothetical protein KDK_66000 [Dictyobacter kobayashii]
MFEVFLLFYIRTVLLALEKGYHIATINALAALTSAHFVLVRMHFLASAPAYRFKAVSWQEKPAGL